LREIQLALSRAFHYFINQMFSTGKHLLYGSDTLKWWHRNGFWDPSAEAIGVRMRDRYDIEGINMVSHFIDCNRLPTSRCGGGPAQEGANSAR